LALAQTRALAERGAISQKQTLYYMGNTTKILLMLVVLAIGGGLAFLLTWNIPPPTDPIEIALPDERFEK
tara:strand:+ start:1401 stop:1610 length:210 start_codon:yes stop_codon:yes gene_type:complete